MKKKQKGMFIAGRALVGLFYIFTGANHFLDLNAMRNYAGSMGVPFPTAAVILSGLLLLVAGITFLIGLKPEIGILSLTVFYIPVSFMMHPFWSMTGQTAQTEMINFIKNMALLGSALCFTALPRPWPMSIDLKLKKASSAEQEPNAA